MPHLYNRWVFSNFVKMKSVFFSYLHNVVGFHIQVTNHKFVALLVDRIALDIKSGTKAPSSLECTLKKLIVQVFCVVQFLFLIKPMYLNSLSFS